MTPREEPFWTKYTDDELLKVRICDLKLSLEVGALSERVHAVLQELDSRGQLFKPLIYLGDEWFSPEGVAAVSIPFFLAHPRLIQLEKAMMLECEGESEYEFSALLRHELGHAFDHAFKVSKRKKWQSIFGSPHKDYHPETYHPRPYSRSFVHNIPRWYAQAHPDEDFAETFAVCLNPLSNWKERYKKWGAIKKLEYVESLMNEFAHRSGPPVKGRMISEARFLTQTLKTYYARKQKAFAEDYPDFYDRDLKHIFSVRSLESKGSETAFRFMKRNQKEIIATIAYWTDEKKVTINELVSKLTARCAKLDLVVTASEAKTLLEVSTYLATLISNYLFTGHFKRTV